MDLAARIYSVHDSQALPPISNDGSSLVRPPSHSAEASFPIIAILVIGILATAFVLLSYYIFVIKCCLNWDRVDFLLRFSLSRRRRDDPLMVYSPEGIQTRGLDDSVIRSIPVFQFKKVQNKEDEERNYCECAVCLTEFQDNEKLRIIPNCAHVFHIDCIDVWLQNNANCPLCRNSISGTSHFYPGQVIAPSTSPQHPTTYDDNVRGGNEDFVVIELGDNAVNRSVLPRRQERRWTWKERSNSAELPSVHSISPSPRIVEQRLMTKESPRKLYKCTSIGDECINIRGKDDQFSIQPIRRSFSMDSSTDRQLFLAIQEVVRQNRQENEICPIEGSSSRVRRSFFSFGHDRSSRSAVLPVYLDP